MSVEVLALFLSQSPTDLYGRAASINSEPMIDSSRPLPTQANSLALYGRSKLSGHAISE